MVIHFGSRICLFFGGAVLVVVSYGSATASAQVLSVTHSPRLTNDATLQVIVTVKAPSTVDAFDGAFIAPPGFTVDPQSVTLAKFTGTTVRTINIKAVTPRPPSGEYNAVARATHSKGQETTAEALNLKFTYQNDDISVRKYLWVGFAGLLLGYWMRIFIKLLSAVTPEAPEQTAGPADGPLTRLVKKHYYLIDCAVTLLLGFGALISLATADAPPAFASRTRTAFLVGMTVGLLTNSELVTKLTSRLPAKI